MALTFNIPQDIVAAVLRTRINTCLVNNGELRRGPGSTLALTEIVEKRADALTELAQAHFAPKLANGAPALKISLRAMGKPDSGLAKAFADYIENHAKDFPHNFVVSIPDKSATYGVRFSATSISNRLVGELCNDLEKMMLVNKTEAAPVTARTIEAKALTDKVMGQEKARGAA